MMSAHVKNNYLHIPIYTRKVAYAVIGASIFILPYTYHEGSVILYTSIIKAGFFLTS